jgi:GYF domain 2
MSKPSDSNKTEWYCKISDEELGPLTTDDLQACVKDGAVTKDTLIKLGASGKWVKAHTIDNLLTSNQEDLTSTVAAASKALSGIDLKRAALSGGKSSESSIKRNRSQKSTGIDLSGIFAIPSLIAEFLAEKLSFLGYLFRLWIIIPVFLIGSGILIYMFYITPWYYQENTFDQYQIIWSELKQLRSEKASDEEWDNFHKTSSVKLKKTIASLKKTASAKNQEHLFLLRAGRDYLNKMLDDARLKPSQSENQFEKQMKIIEMMHLYPDSIPNQKSISPLTLLIIIIDLVIVGLIVFFLFRKRSY